MGLVEDYKNKIKKTFKIESNRGLLSHELQQVICTW